MPLDRSVRPLAQCLRCTRHDRSSVPTRSLTTTFRLCEETTTTSPSIESTPPPIESTPVPNESTTVPTGSHSAVPESKPPPWKGRRPLSPLLVHTPRSERKLLEKHNKLPVGSRRRRATMASTHPQIPFSQLPYQCFQEARKILREDRAEKVEEITKQRERIERLKAQEGGEGEREREHRLKSMRRRLEETKIWADINDPLVKKRFEDGDGDMTKPIYRHLASLQWHNYKRKILLQRIDQMNVIPDVLPHIDPTVSTSLSFPYDSNKRTKNVQHGDFIPSLISESPPRIAIQPFDAGSRLVTLAVMNPDVPNVAKDGFDYRCHFLASNIPISPTQTFVDLGKLNDKDQIIIPWLPPYAQKGLPYQRMSVFVLQQPAPTDAIAPSQEKLDVPTIQKAGRYTEREGFILRSFVNKYNLHPVGVDLFRTQYDEGTAEVMRRAGVVGWDVEFKRKRIEPLPYKRLKAERFR